MASDGTRGAFQQHSGVGMGAFWVTIRGSKCDGFRFIFLGRFPKGFRMRFMLVLELNFDVFPTARTARRPVLPFSEIIVLLW